MHNYRNGVSACVDVLKAQRKCCDKSLLCMSCSARDVSGPPSNEKRRGYHRARQDCRIVHVRRSQLVSLSGKRKSRLSGWTISTSTSTSLSSPSTRRDSMRFSFFGRGIITG